MEDHSPVSPEATGITCVHCQMQEAVPGHSINLCSDCRAGFNRYPIPKWIYAFALGIAVLMVIGLARMPRYFTAAVHLGRAKKAIAAHKYITAQREADIVLQSFPHQLDANVYRFIAAAYNIDGKRLASAGDEIAEKKVDDLNDEKSFASFQEAQAFIKGLAPDDTTVVQKADSISHTDTATMRKYLATLQDNDYAYAATCFASRLYDDKNYSGCMEMAQLVLDTQPNSYGAKSLKLAAMRNTGDYEGALQVCRDLLRQNQEDTHTIAQEAKIEIKRGGHDREAEQEIKQALALRPDDVGVLSAQVLLYHYTGREAQGQKVLADVDRISVASGDTSTPAWLHRILSGQETYR